MRSWTIIAILIIVSMIFYGCQKKVITEKASMDYVQKQLDKLAPVTLTYDLSYLPAKEIRVIRLLVKAATYMDDLFLSQVYRENPDILKTLEHSKNPDAKAYLDMFKIMFGPWNRLEEDQPFINTVPKPDGANFYPEDMTKEEFNNWVQNHPDDREAFESNFTIIRRKGKKLEAIPYSEFYKDKLKSVAEVLRNAAELTSDKTLKTYLNSRADAFLSNDYYQSDMDWMDLAGDIEIVIGPYEVYEDKLFGYKAAFESFVCVVDHEESDQQKKIEKYLNDMEANLPIADKHKNFERGGHSPFKVVNLLYSSGDTKAGIQTSAFNLPNDERVREAKGSKKVMLKNVMKAKFEKCWIPIVQTALAKKDLDRVSFEGYFTHTVMHEVSHGLGPGKIVKNGEETTVNKELKDLYSIIEECKADVLGIYNTQYLIDRGVFPKELENTIYASNCGGMFRSIRFGIDEAHGAGVAIQMNYYLEKRAYKVDKDGHFSVDDRKIKNAVKELAEKLLIIEAEGDYDKAKALIDQYVYLSPQAEEVVNKLKDVPIDIRPIYPIEKTIE
jgi:hypothetical protein